MQGLHYAGKAEINEDRRAKLNTIIHYLQLHTLQVEITGMEHGNASTHPFRFERSDAKDTCQGRRNGALSTVLLPYESRRSVDRYGMWTFQAVITMALA